MNSGDSIEGGGRGLPRGTATKAGNILIPVDDLDEAIAFYNALGLATKFRDGDRFAALDGGGVTIALAAPEEQVAGKATAPSYKVEDVAQAVQDALGNGAQVVTAPEEGPHEIRAVLRDPSGNAFVLYQSR